MGENKLIIIKQLPIIEENLKQLSVEMNNKVANALNLVVSDENIKEVKKIRADLNSDFKELESQRKIVKEKILAPYNEFENIYKTYVSDIYKNADIELKAKIDSIENEQKKIKTEEIRKYFNELCEAKGINFVSYEQADINVTLSASIKSLKELVKKFVDKISDDVILINTQDFSDEIMYEFKQNLNVSKAIATVKERHIAIEESKKKETENNDIQSEEMIEKVETLSAPTKEEILELTFKVRGTKEKLRELKLFLENGGYDYE